MSRIRITLVLLVVGGFVASVWRISDVETSEAVAAAGEAGERERSRMSQRALPEQPVHLTTIPVAAQREERAGHKPDRVNSLMKLLPDGRTRGRISKPVIEDFVTRSGRSSGSLLTAFRESGDRSYLEEAAASFPNDPRVQFAMITDPEARAERDRWIAAFQESAPENALADYFAALAAYERKEGELALEELGKASRKTVFSDYLWDVADGLETLYIAGGLPPAEAKAMAMFSIPLPHLAEMQTLAGEMQGGQKALREAGNNQRADELLAIHLQLGRALGDEPAATLLHRLVGFAVERKAIENAPPAATLAILGAPGSERLEEIHAIREEILQSVRGVDITSAPVSDEEIVHYFEIVRAQGELAALQWLGEQTQAR